VEWSFEMKNNRNKNFTLYWMTAISAVLTVPIAMIILKKIQSGVIQKTIMIMAVFMILLIAIMILYKYIFGVSVQEITQEEKVTELDRLNFRLAESRKEHHHVQLRRCIDITGEQIQRFKRRKNVMFQVSGTEPGTQDSSSFSDLVQTVEDAIVIYVQRILHRVEIFDDNGLADINRQHINYLEEQIHKINDILLEFETLITETSRMGEFHEEKDISKLRDVVNAMKSLRTEQEDEMDTLSKKYEFKGEKQ
jgi:hypothetical protein